MLNKIKQNSLSYACFLIAFIIIVFSVNMLKPENKGAGGPKIALILNTSAGQNSVLMKQGALLACRELGISLSVFTPLSDKEVEDFQIEKIDEIISQGFTGVMIVPVGEERIKNALKKLDKHHVKWLCLDAPLNSGDYCYVGTDHENSGEMLMTSLLNDNTPPLSILIVKNSNNMDYINKTVTDLRLRGMFKEFKSIYSLNSIRSLDFHNNAELIDIVKNKNIAAVICMDSLLTEKAIASFSEYENKPKIYGFDCNQMHLKYFGQGLIEKEFIRSSLTIAYKGINTLLCQINSKAFEKIEYIDAYIVDKKLSLENSYAELFYPTINN